MNKNCDCQKEIRKSVSIKMNIIKWKVQNVGIDEKNKKMVVSFKEMEVQNPWNYSIK